MAAKTDYYDTLGVSKSASADELKKAYRKQALEWHPDRHKDNKEAAEKRFKEINEAYQILSDPQKKQQYDTFGHSGPGYGGAPGGQRSYTYSTSNGQNPFGNFDFGDPFDIFEQFFSPRGPASGWGRQQRSVPRYSLSIDFMEAIEGTERTVSINNKKRTIKIPAGIDEGSSINFGDFILSVNIRPHEVFERDSADIYAKEGIPFSLAVLGGTVKVPTIDGLVQIKIRPGTKSNTMMRISGKGATKLRGRGRGDHYIKIEVQIPEKLTRNQKKLVEDMKKEGL